jgi:hypothetical protein
LIKYRRDIDGLRAVAVMSVVLFHAGLRFFPGGFVGVDVFFVISGYLITSLIAPEIEAGCFSFSTFYKRRIGSSNGRSGAVIRTRRRRGFFWRRRWASPAPA